MFVDLDESGDAGFRFTRGSSRFLLITLLLVDDPIPIQAAVDDVRRALGFNPYDEFKFNHSDEAVRLRVLRELRRQRFSARSLVVDKTLISRADLRRQDALYDELVRTILVFASDAIRDATLVLDQSVKSRRRQDHLSTLLRQALNTDPQAPKVAHFVYHESHRDNLIQATDKVSGAVYVRFHRGDDRYFRIVRSKFGKSEEGLQVWTPGKQ